MTTVTSLDDLPPRDIPADLVAYTLIGGPWWARLLFCLRLLNFIAHTLAPWHTGSYLEIRGTMKGVAEIRA